MASFGTKLEVKIATRVFHKKQGEKLVSKQKIRDANSLVCDTFLVAILSVPYLHTVHRAENPLVHHVDLHADFLAERNHLVAEFVDGQVRVFKRNHQHHHEVA